MGEPYYDEDGITIYHGMPEQLVSLAAAPGDVVLDPFAGSGTTLQVATGHGRDAVGIDIDQRNADLARDRVGPMFLTVETVETQEASV